MTEAEASTASAITRAEVLSQPETWTKVLLQRDQARAILPAAGTPALVVGCGTSYYIGEAYARLRSAAGLGHTRAAVPSEVPYFSEDETLVVLSRSGTTSDIVQLVERVRHRCRVVGIVGDRATPIAQLCDEVVQLDFADERSIVQTRFATSSALLLRSTLAAPLGHLPDEARRALELPLPEPLPQHTVFLGTGWTVALAHEAALKCREAAGAWTEAYPVMEYQHGPIAAAGPDTLVWSFGPLPDFVRGPIEATGARVWVLDLDPLAQLVAVHGLALALSDAAGWNADHPRHLSRSVLLERTPVVKVGWPSILAED